MKKYKVSGKDIEVLLTKVAAKLKVPVDRVGHEVVSEEKFESGATKYILEVWVNPAEKTEAQVEAKSEAKPEVKPEGKAEVVNEKPKSDCGDSIEDILVLSVNEEGAFLTVKDCEVDFNDIINFIAEKDIEAPILENITLAYEDKGNPYKIAEFYEAYYEESTIEVSISDDKMHASFSYTKPKGKNLPLVEEIKKILEENNVKFGIDDNKIKKALALQDYDSMHIVANGIEPVDGEWADIKYFVKAVDKKKSLKPMALEDGKVDFKSLDLIENVAVNQVLAEKIPAEKGVPGKDVTGKVLIAKDGKDLVLSGGKNVKLSQNEKKLIATIDGMVTFTENKLHVLEVYVVPQVGITSGNITFVGGVFVKGDVQSDYEVVAEGNIEVKGNMEKAILKSDGDIVVRGSCFGKNEGKIISKNDVILNFAEAITIEADGNVIVNEGIMNSKVLCGSKITVIDRKGVIIGGELDAAKGVEAINIGSHHGVKTYIEVGSNPRSVEEIKALEEELKTKQKKMDEIEKNILLLQKLKMKLKDEMPEDKKQLFTQMVTAKFSMNKDITHAKNRIEDLEQQAKKVKAATVDVHGICYPGVKIKIRKGAYFVKEKIENVRFYYEDGDVKFTSLV